MDKTKLVIVLLVLATIIYAVSFAYAETSRPSSTGGLGPGDIFVQAYEVLPTDNESVWINAVTGMTLELKYVGELESPNIYVQTAIETWMDDPFVLVPPEDDFKWENGVYQYNGKYYYIGKGVATHFIDAISWRLWLKIHEQRKGYMYAGIGLAAVWAGTGIYKFKERKNKL